MGGVHGREAGRQKVQSDRCTEQDREGALGLTELISTQAPSKIVMSTT